MQKGDSTDLGQLISRSKATNPVADEVRKFIVVAVPRSGSTFLINCIANSCDVFLPNVNQYELFNVYEKLFNSYALHLDGSTEVGMLDGFFAVADRSPAGLKTIPGFHREWHAIVSRQDIQFITLFREDFLSCLASYIVSDIHGGWNHPGRQQLNSRKLVFQELYPTEQKLTTSLGATLNYLVFNYRAVEELNLREQTIRLTTEEMLLPQACNERLNGFFGSSLSFSTFRPPTHYSECFEDHFYFKVVVTRLLRVFLNFDSLIPAPIQSLLEG